MGLVIVCFLFFWFSRGFLCVYPGTVKNLEKTKKNTKKNADPNSPAACTYMGLAILLVLFFCFLEVFCMSTPELLFSRGFLYVYPRTVKNLEKTKKKQKKNADPNSPAACTHMGLVIVCFLFFWFSRGFLCVYTGTVKNLEKTKKKYQKKCRP